MYNAILREIRIVPIAEPYIEGFYRCLDSVARERRHLAFTQAPPFESARSFVLSNIAQNVPQLVALRGDEVVGWCDVSPMTREGFTHCGTLGMGVRKDFRRLGLVGGCSSRRLVRRGEWVWSGLSLKSLLRTRRQSGSTTERDSLSKE
jgi:hypothetical protein